MTIRIPSQTIEYARDPRGTLFAIERVRADHWDPAYLDPPSRDLADARIVELRTPANVNDEDLPAWLRIEPFEPTSLRVAETTPAYTLASSEHGTHLWDASPYFTPTTTSVDEFTRAAASAILAPAPAPYEVARCALTIRRYAATTALLAPFVTLDANPRERWLQRTFGDAEALAYAVLLERLTHDAPEIATTLRTLHDAVIDETAIAYLDLAIDRRALLEQASPWRHYESSGLQSALPAVHHWLRRYRAEYARHYTAVVADAHGALRELVSLEAAANALRQLNTISSLGPAVGLVALHAFERARAILTTLPATADETLACTADVTLGAPHPAIEDARRAAIAIHAALETQRRRLAQRTAHLVLDRTELPALDRLLQALTAADNDAIEGILDARLTQHIEQLIA